RDLTVTGFQTCALPIFDAIYTEGGITRAAEKLHLTQPAISHALGRLRRLLSDELFEREGRAMVPTPFARNLIGPLRQSLRSLEQIGRASCRERARLVHA